MPATIVFDGLCNFCNRWVRFVLGRDRRDQYLFASAQSSVGREILGRSDLSVDDLSTIVLHVGGRSFTKSEAVIRILSGLGGAWRGSALLLAVPRGLRDRAYDLFAQRRYRVFGRCSTCPTPDPSWKDKLIG